MDTTITLDDKYTQKSGRIYLTGLQAIVRIPLMQHQLDVANGLNTGTFISGYRGSPLGAIDLVLNQAQPFLDKHDIVFVPGVNEDLGATAVWGSQQLNLGPGATRDGVVGIWYGKGPGVDRSLDALKHANAAGSSKHGGVLALAGDDHACKSSTFPHQSEQGFIHAMIPTLHPAGIEDALWLGMHGIAMSRYSGCWTGFKVISDFADSSASVFTDPFKMSFVTPTDFDMPEGGLNIRWYDPPVDQEARLVNFKLPAAQAYARANGLDRYTINPQKKRIGIVATGKAWMDTLQALEDMGITKQRAEEMGIALYKVALVWPMEDTAILKLAHDVEEIIVIEEKRGVMEDQIKNILYHMDADKRPRVVGKRDETGRPFLAETYELSPAEIGDALVKRLKPRTETNDFEKRLQIIHNSIGHKKEASDVERIPYYCSGCPHNTSTRVPEGSRALAGIGCHYMAMWMDRSTYMFTQMGGEGVPWIGQQPFTDEKHVFANLGDGTYFHSGILAIRASVAAKSNITYKILYNDAVAMTGGQPVDGDLPVATLAQQVFAEGVSAIHVVSDEPEKYGAAMTFPKGTKISHRDNLDDIQKELRETQGVTILIYDQTCAAEKRRRRKRGLMYDPPKRVVINERVCEGCGDCGVQSNCMSIAPVETEFGRKRQIDQSSCNKDFSCLKGFCPSFVTILGGNLKKPTAAKTDDSITAFFNDMPDPVIDSLDKPKALLVTGIGGTGIVTVGAIMAMAAHLEGKGATTMDQTGLAQKGGAVTSHVRIAKTPEDINTVRIDTAGADVVIGCDILVTSTENTLSKLRHGQTQVILNTQKTQTGEFTKNTEWDIPTKKLINTLERLVSDDCVFALEATEIATALLGNSIATNMFMLGYAYQNGLLPISEDAFMRAIELNGVAIKMNQSAFMWGRRAAWNIEKVRDIAIPQAETSISMAHRAKAETTDDRIQRRVTSLTAYQNKDYADQYLKLVNTVKEKDIAINGVAGEMTENVIKYYYKLMAYKDEYEVARLYTDGAFKQQIKNMFEGNYKLEFNLAPPLLAKRDSKGHLKKMTFGPWILPVFSILAKFKFLRGSIFDIFGYTAERKMERQLIQDYQSNIERVLQRVNKDNYTIASAIAAIPEHIRGYGHVKEEHLQKAKSTEMKLMDALENPQNLDKKAA